MCSYAVRNEIPIEVDYFVLTFVSFLVLLCMYTSKYKELRRVFLFYPAIMKITGLPHFQQFSKQLWDATVPETKEFSTEKHQSLRCQRFHKPQFT